MSKVSLIVATPTRQQIVVPYVSTLLDLFSKCRDRKWGFAWMPDGTSPCWLSRDRCVSRFLATDATHLLFLDDDTGVDPADLVKLVESGHQVAAIAYRKKTPNKHAHEFVTMLSDWQQEPSADGFVKANSVGAGALLIRREALVSMRAHFGASLEYGTGAGPMYGYFKEITSPNYISEDYSFCQRHREAGGDVQILLNAASEHLGQSAWSGNLADCWPIMQKAGREAGLGAEQTNIRLEVERSPTERQAAE